MGEWLQKDKWIRTGDQPLGKDVLLVDRLEGEEALSQPFEFRLDLRSENQSIAPAQIVGKSLTVSIDRTDDSNTQRYFNGVVTRFENQGKIDRDMSLYKAVLRPWFHLLDKTSDCKIFQQLSALEIVKKVLGESGFGPLEVKVNSPPPQREYCVQYNETDFQFVSRLLEEEGIYYYFRHANGQHTMVLGDNDGALGNSAESSVSFKAKLPEARGLDRLRAWSHGYELQPGKWAHTDYNFETPNNDLLAQSSAKGGVPPMPSLEMFNYPGIHKSPDVGQTRATVRAEQEVSGYDTVKGQSVVETFSPGLRFSVSEHHNPSEAGQYVLTAVKHKAQQEGTYATPGESRATREARYMNEFVALPKAVKVRPRRLTLKPRVQGPQTAVVVGPSGDEIWTDKYGRVKVQFFWDRYGKRDDKSSCWIRVAYVAAGATFGLMSIPRVGHEVVVEFLDGDPDRPLVTGVVYNAANTQPLSSAGDTAANPSNVPNARMMTTWRSNSLGKSGGFNEITMNDTGGSEGLYFKAQKDEVHLVGNNRKDTVTKNETLKVGVDRSREVGNNETIKIGAALNETIGTKETVNVGSDRSITVGGDDSLQVTSNRSVNAGQSISESSLQISITAQTKITLTCGASTIQMTPAMISINAPLVKIN